MKFRQQALTAGLIAAGLLLATGAAQAGTVIFDTGVQATGHIALGVNDNGGLNTTPNITSNAVATGLAFRFPDGTYRDATSPGCLCEGWGVSFNNTTSGFANADVPVSGGSANLTSVVLPRGV